MDSGAAVLRATAQELLLASTSLPDLTQFVTGKYEVCLKNARWHPLSVGSGKAIESYLECKQHGVWTPPDQVSASHRHLKQDFTTLINADPSEIAYVSSTTTGEGRFLGALGFSEADGKKAPGNIVTDAPHFEWPVR